MCLQLAGVEKDHEVLVPALTFVATANAVTYLGAVPHFVDCEESTLGLNPKKLEEYLNEAAELRSDSCFNRKTGRLIKAVVAVHTFGHPVDLDPLVELCQRFKIELIEDAAESLGSFYKGRHTGNEGRFSALSFNGNKVVTTGGGGAILTHDEKSAQLAKYLTTTAKNPHPRAYYHGQIGYNFRLPNINAALGCAQLENLSGFLKDKRALARVYQKTFSTISGVELFLEPKFAQSNYWLNVLLLDHDKVNELDSLLEQTSAKGIMTRPATMLVS